MNLAEQNPLKPKPVKPSLGMELSLEFVRISKLTESGKKDEAWRAANALYGEYPKEATPNFIIALILTAIACRTWAKSAKPFSCSKPIITATGLSRFITTTISVRAARSAVDGLVLSWRTLMVCMMFSRYVGTLAS